MAKANPKYVIHKGYDDIETPYVFPDYIPHKEFAYSIVRCNGGDVISAGFVAIYLNRCHCYGESVSLGLKAREEHDGAIIKKALAL